MKTFTIAIVIFITSYNLGTAQESRGNQRDFIRIASHSNLTDGIGVVYASINNEIFICTGTLIAGNYILTTAECVGANEGMIAQEISFVPGFLKQSSTTNNRYFIKQVWVNKDYLKLVKDAKLNEAFEHNIAILEVRTNELDHPNDFPGSRYKTKEISASIFDPETVYEGLYLGYLLLNNKNNKALYRTPLFKYTHLTNNSYTTTEISPSSAGGSALQGRDNKIRGILSGVLPTGEISFAKITEEHKSEINKIIQGQGEEALKYSSTAISSNPYFSVNLENRCDKTIFIATWYKSIVTNDFETKGFYKVDPGEIISDVFRTRNKNIAFYAQDKDANSVWSGKDYNLELGGETYNFYAKTLPDDWKDKTFIWTCDD